MFMHRGNNVRVNIHVLHADLAATGATLSRGLNRTFATLVAVFLAVGAHMAANLCGENGEPILLSVFVFLVGTYAAGPSMFATTNCIVPAGMLLFSCFFC